jgi:hypothetical protein
MKTSIWVTSQFVGFHRWVNAPDDVAFLRSYHRHVFHVKVHIPVTHQDRDVEFFTFKKRLDAYLSVAFHETKFDQSCEMIAEKILGAFDCASVVEVSEDGENGAIVSRE